MDFKRLDKGIIVADKDYFPLLYSFRNSHPELSLKIWNENDILRRLSCSFDKGMKDPIPYLLKKGITYPNAKKYLNLIRVSDLSKNAKLSSLYEDLKQNGYLKFDELGEREISRGNLFLFEMQEDVELHSFLRRKNITFADLEIEELGVSKSIEGDKHPPIYLFEDKFRQYSYLYSCLRKKLQEDPSSSKRIVVLAHDEKDEFYAKLGTSLFGVPSSFNVASSLLNKEKIKKKVTEIHSTKTFAFSEEEKTDKDLAVLYEFVSHYGLANLEPSFAYATLLDILSANEVRAEAASGIAFTSSSILDPSLLFYVTNFQYNDFYEIATDKNILSDDELLAVCANPSYVKTELDKRKKRNFLLYNNIVFLSRVAKHLTDKIYDSPFVEEFGWKSFVEKKGWNEEGAHTSDSEKLYRTDQLDSVFYRKKIDDLLSYDHSYKKVEGKPLIQPKKWSASSLERYPFCPFQYLLNSFFPFDPSACRITGLGKLNHSMMESLYSDDFDFEAKFAESAKAYIEGFEKYHVPFDAQEEAFLSIYKHWLKQCVKAMRGVKEENIKALEVSEQSIFYALKDEDGTEYPFSGRIDKILFTEHAGRKFYTIIDYKSGSERFAVKNVFLGASTQLPLYALALKEENNAKLVKGAIFAGFGIHHSFVKSPKKLTDGETVSESPSVADLKFKGPLVNCVDFWNSLDPTAVGKSGNVKKSGGKFFSPSSFFKSESEGDLVDDGIPYTVDDLLNDAKAGALNSIRNILANEFPIRPTSFNLRGDLANLACNHCGYGDICYRNKSLDAVSYEDEIAHRFAVQEEGGAEDDED